MLPTATTAPIRVLQVVGYLLPGGIETWLLNVIRHLDPNRFKVDVVISTQVDSPLAGEIERLGSKIHVCSRQSKPIRYALKLAQTNRKGGPYDIIHANLHHMNGIVSLGGFLGGIPIRIVHSHNAVVTDAARQRIGRFLIRRFANGALACSGTAGSALFGGDWQSGLRGGVLQCGIDLTPFRARVDRGAIRSALGIPSEANVVGHVGRFSPEKNHSFILKIAEAYGHLDPHAHFLLVGDGPLREELKARVAASPMAGRIHLPGARYDVPQLMLGAMDCFLFPSHHEGLGLALVEAQAAGLPSVYSDVIPTEADIYPDILWRMSLQQPAEEWARTIQQAIRKSTPEFRAAAYSAVESSPFNLIRSLDDLQNYYLQLCKSDSSPEHLRRRATELSR